jgi:hypothetical protein
MKNNTYLQRIILGLKEGWNIPTLPEKKIRLHEHPYTRIFRFIGGICVLLTITKKVFLFPKIFI